MQPDLTWAIAVRLLLAAVLGGLVGLERELRRKPAGLRTNMFICLGSALFTLLSQEISTRFGDPSHTRIAANLIPGIGFLGAGAIIRERGSVMGLTTAATIFVLASIGMAVGAGLYQTAIFASLLSLVTLTLLGWIEDRLSMKTRLMTFRLTTAQPEETIIRVNQALAEANVAMQRFQVSRVGSETLVEFDAEVSPSEEKQVAAKFSTRDVRCDIVSGEKQRE